MHVEWYGQSSFRLEHDGVTVFVDPFDLATIAASGRRWDYPPITGIAPELLLVTHEHLDHNGVDVIEGEPVTLRSTAGTFASPVGEVVGVASEHDDVAGSQRGANVMFSFAFGGVRVAHLGDLGQPALRPEQLAALGPVELLFVPVGGHATIGAATAHAVAAQVGARTIIPMHYRTERIDFLDRIDAFLAPAARVEHTPPAFALEALPAGDGPLVVVPAAP